MCARNKKNTYQQESGSTHKDTYTIIVFHHIRETTANYCSPTKSYFPQKATLTYAIVTVVTLTSLRWSRYVTSLR